MISVYKITAVITTKASFTLLLFFPGFLFDFILYEIVQGSVI